MFKRLVSLAVLFFSSQIANAGDSYQNPIMRAQTPQQQYMVSVMLKKNTETTTVRLVQSVEKANSKEEASGIMFNRIKSEFPGYSVVDSVIGIIPNDRKECETWL